MRVRRHWLFEVAGPLLLAAGVCLAAPGTTGCDGTGSEEIGAGGTGAGATAGGGQGGTPGAGGSGGESTAMGGATSTAAGGSGGAGTTTGGGGTGSTAAGGAGMGGSGGGLMAEAVPDFSLVDMNPASATYGQAVSPHDHLGRVSAWYFGHST